MTKMTLDDFRGRRPCGGGIAGARSRFSKVVLAGHSEGASLAVIAARQGPRLLV